MEYEYNEKIILFWAVILSIAINELFLFGGFGISVPLYIMIYYTFIVSVKELTPTKNI